MDVPKTREALRFEDFELDVVSYELRRQGRRVRVERRPMDLLILLVQRRGELVTRSEIVERLWGKDVFIEVETAVNTLVRKVRQALRDSSGAPRFVETVQGKGYRFIAGVEVVPAQPVAVPVPAASFQQPLVAKPPHPQRLRPQLIAGVASFAVVVAVGIAIWRVAWPAEVRLAVLPFSAIKIDPGLEYLADALHEETIASLGQIDPDHLRVVGRTSMLKYRNTTESLSRIGRELNVEYLVETAIHSEQGRIRITPKLIRVRDETQIPLVPYDDQPGSILEFQRELGRQIAEQIRLRLPPERLSALARRQTGDADAYLLYLQGQFFWNQLTDATTRRAIEYYMRATAQDPDYALAWAGLALAYAGAPINADARPDAVAQKAREAARHAIRSNAGLAETQTAMGMVQFWIDWDWASAEQSFQTAVDIDRQYPLAQRMVGIVFAHTGEHDRARDPMRRLRELEPDYVMNWALSAQVAFNARDYDAAFNFARRATVMVPPFWIGSYQLAMAAERLTMVDVDGNPRRGDEVALEVISRALSMGSSNSKLNALRGYLLAKTGRESEARAVMNLLQTTPGDRYVPPYAVALILAGLNERDAAFDWLQRAYDVRDVHLVALPTDPKWDPYRADPRFAALLKQCGFKLIRS